MTDSGYMEGFYSIMDEKKTIHFTKYESEDQLLESLQGDWAVKRLQWFSKGFYKVSRFGDEIVLSDLRMGVEPLYFFSFAIGKISPDGIISQTPRQVQPPEIDMRANISLLWRRIWNDEIFDMYEK